MLRNPGMFLFQNGSTCERVNFQKIAIHPYHLHQKCRKYKRESFSFVHTKIFITALQSVISNEILVWYIRVTEGKL